MKYEAIVFDWDGTLVDSAARIVESMQMASEEAGLRSLSDFEVRQIIGLGLPEAIMTLWPEIQAQDPRLELMRELYNKHFISEQRPDVAVFDHAHELFEGLLSKGVELAVATGKSRAGLDRAFKELKLGHFFTASRCADETRSKPDPLMLNQLSHALGVSADAMVMVGDTQWDLDMANAAGIDGVAITHGAHNEAKLAACGPVAMVDSLVQLKAWLLERI